MGARIGFQIMTDQPEDGQPHKVSVQVHQDRAESHWYGGMVFDVSSDPHGDGVRHQLTMALISLIANLGSMTDEQVEAMMKPVERPF